jgi:hypothetical protein
MNAIRALSMVIGEFGSGFPSLGYLSVICNPVVQIAALRQPVYCAQFPAIFQG